MLRPPEHFGRAARKEFRRIVTELEGAGINPATRVALIVATLEADGNIARLQADLARARGNSRVQLTWAVDRAITERRKTAEALWRGQARRVYRPPEPAEAPPEMPRLPPETSDPYWACLFPDDRDRAFWAGRKAGRSFEELEAELGESSWLVILEPDERAAVQSALVIIKAHKHGNARRTVPRDVSEFLGEENQDGDDDGPLPQNSSPGSR